MVSIIIDQSQCFSEAGLKSISELIYNHAQKGRQDAMAAIERINLEGHRMKEIQNGPGAIAQIAKSKFIEGMAPFIYDAIPKSRPYIEVVGENIDIYV